VTSSPARRNCGNWTCAAESTIAGLEHYSCHVYDQISPVRSPRADLVIMSEVTWSDGSCGSVSRRGVQAGAPSRPIRCRRCRHEERLPQVPAQGERGFTPVMSIASQHNPAAIIPTVEQCTCLERAHCRQLMRPTKPSVPAAAAASSTLCSSSFMTFGSLRQTTKQPQCYGRRSPANSCSCLQHFSSVHMQGPSQVGFASVTAAPGLEDWTIMTS